MIHSHLIALLFFVKMLLLISFGCREGEQKYKINKIKLCSMTWMTQSGCPSSFLFPFFFLKKKIQQSLIVGPAEIKWF